MPTTKPDPDPVSDLLCAANLLPKANKVEEWLRLTGNIKFCHCRRGDDDHDDCTPLEDIDAALTQAKNAGLSVFDVIPQGSRRESVPLLVYIFNQASRHNCPYGQEVEFEMLDANRQRVERTSIDGDHDLLGYIIWRAGAIGVSQDGTLKRSTDVPALYLEWKRNLYWMEVEPGRWESMNETAAERKLIQSGLSPARPARDVLSEVEDELINIRDNQSVDWAGKLAGYPAGLMVHGTMRLLVIGGPVLITPQDVPWDNVRAILDRMLMTEEQRERIDLWNKVGYEALRDNRTQAGQLLILCGPIDCLKSYVQHQVITPILGGREANAARYLTGRSEFNADLGASEHLFLDDMKPYGNWLGRHDFAENLKEFVVGKRASIHGKGKDAENLPARWRVTMSLNDDETAIRSLPEFTESFTDKVILLKCQSFALPLPNFTPEQKAKFDEVIRAELPGYIHYLVNMKVPEHLRSNRFIIKHYHNPELVSKVDSMSREAQLAELIDAAKLSPTKDADTMNAIKKSGWYDDGGEAWVGTAAELQLHLMDSRATREVARTLLGFDNATGTLLGKLAKKRPDKCAAWEKQVYLGDGSNRRAKKRLWIIAIPSESTEIDQ